MTAHVISEVIDAPGQGAMTEVKGIGSTPLRVKVLDYNMGTDAYTAGGNDISAIWTSFGFRDVLSIGIEQKDTNTANDNRLFATDYSAKTLLVYTAINTEASGDQGVVAVRLTVVGI